VPSLAIRFEAERVDLTVVELAVVVGDTLRQVDVTALAVALLVDESSTENRN
jgi:hypothetical protein